MSAYCTCKDFAMCGCGNQPPIHCMYCCLDLTPEQIAIEEERFQKWQRENANAGSIPAMTTEQAVK